jgi:hypothetical protein
MVQALPLSWFPRGARARAGRSRARILLLAGSDLRASLHRALAQSGRRADWRWQLCCCGNPHMAGYRHWGVLANVTTFSSPRVLSRTAATRSKRSSPHGCSVSGSSATLIHLRGREVRQFGARTGAMLAATIELSRLVLGSHADRVTDIWMTWWLGDLGGQLLVTPVVVLWGASRFPSIVGVQNLAGCCLERLSFGSSPSVRCLRDHDAGVAFLAIAPCYGPHCVSQRDTATAALVLALRPLGHARQWRPICPREPQRSFLLALMFVISTAVRPRLERRGCRPQT